MSDIQLFHLHNSGAVTELASQTAVLEKTLQTLLEGQMETFLGVRFLVSEYATGKTHRGRIDSLGIDENGCPVIVEYKRHSTENVINQGLFYLDWLLDHKAEFRWLVMEKFGKEAAQTIEWAGTRLLCIASDFTRYDQHAVQQIPRNIELLRYKLFGNELLLLELVNTQSVTDGPTAKPSAPVTLAPEQETQKPAGKDKSLTEQLALATPEIRVLYEQTSSLLLSLGDDVQQKELKLYTAFRRLKNFACVIAYPNRLLVTLKLAPSTITFEQGFSRDVSQVGHWGTGDVELCLLSTLDLQRAQSLLQRSYAEN
jgi:predicted transport protein